MRGLRIAGTGRYIPPGIWTNEDMKRYVDTSDEWIAARTGIRQRHFCDGEGNADMAVKAGRTALEKAGIPPERVGACVVATFTPDHLSPSTACLVQRALGLGEDIPAFDLNAGCTGFVYGLKVMQGLLEESEKPYGLLIGSEVVSRALDFTDRSTCVLFGDGAAAAVVSADPDKRFTCVLGSRGDDHILGADGTFSGRPEVHMDGQAVFRFAVDMVPKCIGQVLKKAGVRAEQVDWFVPHQANRRIVESVIRKLKAPSEKFYQNMDLYGNTSAASIPIALDEMAEKGLLKRGQKVLIVGFGAGLTWGGALLEW